MQFVQAVLFLGAAAVALGVAGLRGAFHPQYLSNTPFKRPKLRATDFLLMLMLFLCSSTVAGIFAYILFVLPFDDAPSAIITAFQTLFMQLMSYSLPLAYLAIRLGMFGPRHVSMARLGNRTLTSSHLKSALGGLLLALTVVFATNLLGMFFSKLLGYPEPESGHELLALFNHTGLKVPLFLILSISVVIVAPFVEEILYRGVVQTVLINEMGKKYRILALLIASAFFAIVHLGSVPLVVIPSLFFLGLILGWLYETTGSLWPGILVHAVFNMINLSLAAFMI